MSGGKKSGPKVHGSSKGLGAKSNKLLGTREQEAQAKSAMTLIRGALQEKSLSKVEDKIKSALTDFLKQQNMEHVKVVVNLKGAKDFDKVEQYVSHVVDAIAKSSPTLFKEGMNGINIVTESGLQEEHNKMVAKEENSFYDTYTPGTYAEVVSQLNFNPDEPRPQNMFLNLYIGDRVPRHLEGMIAHELTHVMEKKWADSLFQDYVMVKTGGRHFNDGEKDEEHRALYPAKGGNAQTTRILKMLQAKSKKDPNFKRQMDFVKEWEGVSAYEIKDVETTDLVTKTTTTVKDWAYNPDRITITQPNMTPQQVVMDAFNLNPAVANYVHSDGDTKSDKGLVMSPSEELAEAVRVVKDPDFPKHMEVLERMNPDAKKYLEGLLSVVAKYDDIVKERLQTVSKNPDVLKAVVKRRRRKSENLEDEASVESQSQQAKKGSTIPF